MVRLVARSWRSVLGSIAGGDLLFRAVAHTPWNSVGDLLGAAADSAAFTAVLTALAGSSSTFGVASLWSRWLLYLIGIYLLVPELLPPGFGEWTDRPVPRALATGGAFSMYLHFGGVVPGPDPLWYPGSTALVAVGFLAYFARGEDPFRPGGELTAVVRTTGMGESGLDPSAASSVHPDATGLRSTVTRAVLATVLCGLLAMMIAFFGMLVFAVGLFFPLPELSVVLWSVYGAVRARVSWLPEPPTRDGDVEASIYDIVGPALRNPLKGILTVGSVAVGLLLSALPLLALVRLLGALTPSEVGALAERPVRGAPTFVLLGGLFLFGAYGLWYWSRVSRRVPGFMLAQDGGDPPAPAVVRPLYLTVPPSFVVVASGSLNLAAATYLHRHPGVEYWPPAYALASGAVWLCGVLVGAVAIRRTRAYAREHGPQKVDDENRTLPTAIALQVLAAALAAPAFYAYDAISAGGLPVYLAEATQTAGGAVLFVGSGVLAFYHAEIEAHIRTLSPVGTVLVRSGFIAAIGVLASGSFGLFSDSWGIAAVIAVGSCLLGALVGVNLYRQTGDEAEQSSGN